MWTIAHRGGGDLFPENTLTAFEQAAALGVDMVECDIHLSRDGELMVIHDPTLQRTGGQPIPVSDLTLAELSRIDVGDGNGVPTLTQILDRIDIPVVTEIKSIACISALRQLLETRPDLIPRIIPISFYHIAVKSLVDQVPGLRGGVLLAGVPVNLAQVAFDAHVQLLSLYHALVTPELVQALHAKNLLVSVWTPNSEEDIAKMVAAHVDGIASDRPDRVLKAVRAG